MATIFSSPVTVTVSNLAYAVPSPRSAVAIGLNSAGDVRPSPDTVGDWSYATMENYGSGCFVEDYSASGAWVVAGTGGHGGAGMYGGLIFDFASARWTYLHNANGMPNRPTSLDASDTNSDGEITLAGVAPGMPAPMHMYRNLVALPKSLGGGPSGSVVMMSGSGPNVAGANTLKFAHRFDLATGMWSKLTTNRRTVNGNFDIENSSTLDPVGKRIYCMPFYVAGVTSIPYVDLNDMTWKVQSRGGADLNAQNTQSCWVDSVRRLMLLHTDAGQLWAIDLSNWAAGPQKINVSGALPGRQNRWAYYPVDGSWYNYQGDGSSTIYKLTPPSATTASISGTWTCSTVSIAGAALPARANMTGANNNHYTRFFYVPALQCLAWIAGVQSSVILIKP